MAESEEQKGRAPGGDPSRAGADQPAWPRDGKPKRWTQERKAAFCIEYAKHGRFGDAAKSVGCGRASAQERRDKDPGFDAMCIEAEKAFEEWTIGKVQSFAWTGVPEPVIVGGRIVGTRRVYSTKMQELEARRVCKGYRDRQEVELTGDPRRPVAVEILRQASTEDLQALRSVVSRIKPRGRG